MIYQQIKGCREWQGAKNHYGYGVRWLRGTGQSVYVHRWIWEQFNGPIPEGMCVLHTCDDRACYLLEHLWLGTRTDNNADRDAKGRARGGGKLTSTQVTDIHAALSIGEEDQQSIGERYGVTQGTISRIKTGVTWKWLAEE